MKPAAPPLLRATRLLDLARERIRTNTIALRIGLGHAMESFIVEAINKDIENASKKKEAAS